jgi:hypothetical protein
MRTCALHLSSFVLVLAAALPASADSPSPIERSIHPVTLAVIGDSPYGSAQVADFPNLVAAINADSEVTRVVHVGDIKNGSTRCDQSYFELIAGYFDTFKDGLVYTPGDNEWTDCHRSNNGKYNPLERLSALRTLFFADPEVTLGGQTKPLFSQANTPGYEGQPENQAWVQARTVFATLHVVGSRNGLATWFGDDTSDALVDHPTSRLADVTARTQAAIDWVDEAFELAAFPNTQGVVLFMQADTWPGNAQDGFSTILARIAERALAFGKPVLVVQGDTHVYRTDRPLLNGDAPHGISFSVPNLTRVVVQGETTAEWLKLTVDPKAPKLFSWQRMFR